MLIFVGRNSVVFFVVHYPLIYVWIGLLLWFGVHSILLITASSFVLASGLCTVLAYVRERRGTMDYLYVMPEPLQALTRWAILPALRRVLQLGRASGRERGWQYVYVSGGGGLIKKKK